MMYKLCPKVRGLNFEWGIDLLTRGFSTFPPANVETLSRNYHAKEQEDLPTILCVEVWIKFEGCLFGIYRTQTGIISWRRRLVADI
jgi:hypothetical protein